MSDCRNELCLQREGERRVNAASPHGAVNEAHPSVCRRSGLPEYPVMTVYAGRRMKTVTAEG